MWIARCGIAVACQQQKHLATMSFLPNIEIITADETRLVFKYTVPQVRFSSVKIGGDHYNLVSIENTDYEVRSGYPMLPVRTFTIGIPPEGVLAVRMLEAEFIDSVGVLIVPVPSRKFEVKSIGKGTPGIIAKVEVNDAVYSQDAFFPENPLPQHGLFSWLRHQRVLELRFYPLLFNPRQKLLRMYRRAQIEIVFNRSSIPNVRDENRSYRAESDRLFETVYSNVILNYEHSRYWRGIPIPKSQSLQIHGNNIASYRGAVWYKFFVEEDGLYEITYGTLEQAGIHPQQISPAELHIYNGGGRALALELQAEEPALQEIATYFDDKNHNGQFDPDDRLLFYATGISGWENDVRAKRQRHFINYYTAKNTYWLAVGGGNRKAMQARDIQPHGGVNITRIEKFPEHIFREDERVIPDYQFFSGVNWYWDRIASNQTKEYSLTLPDVIPDDTVWILLHIKGWTEVPHPLSVYLNRQLLFSTEIPFTLEQTLEHNFTSGVISGENILGLQLAESSIPGANVIYLDWIEVHYWRALRASGDQLHFRLPGKKGFYEYAIQNFSADSALVFDITDPFNVLRILNLHVERRHSIVSVLDSVDTNIPHEFLVLSPENIRSIAQLSSATNPMLGLRDTLNRAEYLIIAHPSLMGTALEQLEAHLQDGALWRDGKSPLVKTVNIEQIYDEFAWGMFDPTAIRNFLRYAYRHWQVAPSYVLLVGDASFDYKNNSGRSLPNFVPTYEDPDIATDDWFVYLTEDGKMDMLLGRLPARNQSELNIMVDKIIAYDSDPVYGPWKNTVVLVADDEYSDTDVMIDRLFTIDSENIAHRVIPHSYELSKIYLMAYPMRDLAGNKPEAKKAFLEAFNQGALLVNFIGHGNYKQLTHETIFYTSTDIGSLNNGMRLPVFIAATCEAGRFDGNTLERESMAEEMLRRQSGGVVATVAATRWGLSTANVNIARGFIEQVLGTNKNAPKTFGEALAIAKLKGGFPEFTRFINLLGLPSEYLAFPKGQISFFSSPDTIKSGSIVRLMGQIQQGAMRLKEFSGWVMIRAFDAERQREEPVVKVSYTLPGRIFYNEDWKAQQGIFDSAFVVHSDSLEGGPSGKIVAYTSGQYHGITIDAAGSVDSIYTISSVEERDSSGPAISIMLEGRSVFELNNQPVGFDPTFTIQIADGGSGINLSANYGIRLEVDNNASASIDLTPFFSGTLKEGSITYTLVKLKPGKHQLKVIAWDNALNKSESTFAVLIGSGKLLSDVTTYPNPTRLKTSFYFHLEQDAEITIKVYTVAGRLVKIFRFVGAAGLNLFPEEPWDLRDEDGDYLANGIYFYKIIAVPIQGQSVEAVGIIDITK